MGYFRPYVSNAPSGAAQLWESEMTPMEVGIRASFANFTLGNTNDDEQTRRRPANRQRRLSRANCSPHTGRGDRCCKVQPCVLCKQDNCDQPAEWHAFCVRRATQTRRAVELSLFDLHVLRRRDSYARPNRSTNGDDVCAAYAKHPGWRKCRPVIRARHRRPQTGQRLASEGPSHPERMVLAAPEGACN